MYGTAQMEKRDQKNDLNGIGYLRLKRGRLLYVQVMMSNEFLTNSSASLPYSESNGNSLPNCLLHADILDESYTATKEPWNIVNGRTSK